jgi:hypothetical protein
MFSTRSCFFPSRPRRARSNAPVLSGSGSRRLLPGNFLSICANAVAKRFGENALWSFERIVDTRTEPKALNFITPRCSFHHKLLKIPANGLNLRSPGFADGRSDLVDIPTTVFLRTVRNMVRKKSGLFFNSDHGARFELSGFFQICRNT